MEYVCLSMRNSETRNEMNSTGVMKTREMSDSAAGAAVAVEACLVDAMLRYESKSLKNTVDICKVPSLKMAQALFEAAWLNDLLD